MTDTVDVDADVTRIGKFRGLGVAMGLEGKPLTQYIERSMEKHDERVREERQAERVREERQAERIREERQAERETAKEIELAKLQANKELELARLQAETERGRAVYTGGLSNLSRGPSRDGILRRGPQIVMPNFDEKTDLIDNFCMQFEKLAALHGVPEDQWAINLSAFLLGAAKDVYHSLTGAEVDDYRVLKAALLKHYELSADSYRKMFRETQKKASETHHQFHARVKMVFDKWLKMSGAEVSYKGLREEVLKEQVLGSYRRDLTVFLMEKGFTTLEEVAGMADRYETAHSAPLRQGLGNHKEKAPLPMQPNENSGMPPEPNGVPFRSNGVPPKPQDQLPNPQNKRQVEGRRDLCFKCQQPGHRARECRSRPFSVNALFPVMSLQVNGQPKDYANTTPVMVNGSEATALLDTGCQYPILVHERHVRDEDRTDQRVSVHEWIYGDAPCGLYRI